MIRNQVALLNLLVLLNLLQCHNQVAHLDLLDPLNLLQFQNHQTHLILMFQAFKVQVLTLHQVTQQLHGLVFGAQTVAQVLIFQLSVTQKAVQDQIFHLLEAHLLNKIN